MGNHIPRINLDSLDTSNYYGGAPPQNTSLVNSLSIFGALIMALFNKSPQVYPASPEDKYDFVIVGAGAAGSIIASRLSEVSDWKILLLEAGGQAPEVSKVPGFYYYSFGSPMNWKYTTQAQPEACNGKPCNFPSGRVFGGTTAINGMVYNRGNRHIFDSWAELGNHGWSYEDILPYFKKSENNLDPQFANDTTYHSVGGYQSVQQFPYQDVNTKILLNAMSELGYPEVDVNGANQYGYMLEQTFTHNGERQNVFGSFIEPVRYKRHNLDIVPYAFVTKVLIDPISKKAYGVEYLDRENKTVSVNASKEVIVSAGAFNSPKLLQLSGLGPEELLNQFGIDVISNLKVGENLNDHVSGGLGMLLFRTKQMPRSLGQIMNDYIKFVKYRGGPLSSFGACQLILYGNSGWSQDLDFPDIQLIFGGMAMTPIYWKMPNPYYNGLGYLVTNVATKSRGYVRINSTDPFSHPVINFNYLKEMEDMERLIDGFYIGIKLSHTKSLWKFPKTLCFWQKCWFHICGSREYIRCFLNGTVIPAYHATGTCKMGPSSDPDAIVDPTLKVHGISSLRVADASVMPTPVNSNTQAATMMIGEKAADLIKQEWGEG